LVPTTGIFRPGVDANNFDRLFFTIIPIQLLATRHFVTGPLL
jgi:hypothetical protein